jgi:acyl-coenzyme A synthetase/AMP-(fatty) acid ligase
MSADQVVYRGKVVDTDALHEVLMRHPHVVDAMVLGDPLDDVESQPIAFVTIDRALAVSEESLLEYVALRVAPGQRLRGAYLSVATAARFDDLIVTDRSRSLAKGRDLDA